MTNATSRVAVLLTVALASGRVLADDSPADLHWETEGVFLEDDTPFDWHFDGAGRIVGPEGGGADPGDGVDPDGRSESCGQLTEASGGAFPVFGRVAVDGFSVCPAETTLAYGERGFTMEPDEVGNSLSVTRQIFVPAAGGDFARWADRLDNAGVAARSVDVVYTGTVGPGDFFGASIVVVDTSSGDESLTTDDDWAVFDDQDEDGGMPAVAVVWQGESAPVRATNITYDFPAQLRVTFTDVPVQASARATVVLFAVQANSREEAAALAQDLTVLGGVGSDFLDEDLGSLANFTPTEPGAPRVRWSGPFTVPEGGEIVVSATAEDLEGEPMTYEWDLDGDGQFDDLAGILSAPVSAATIDGPATIRLGLRVTDATLHVSERHVTVAVQNVDPVITSVAATAARTDDPYSYAIVATDHAQDPLGYRLEDGPAGMVVNASGVVSWTPQASGIGPDIPVSVTVSDGDGGETSQAWTIHLGGAPSLQPGGPYTVDEGGDVRLAPTVADPEGDVVTFAWDLDGDGVFDDETSPAVTWSAEGIDGPAEGFAVSLVISDGEFDVQTTIPVRVRNVGPVFHSMPPSDAVVSREWVYEIEVVDPGDDELELELREGAPAGMVLDGRTLRWTPTAADLDLESVEVTLQAEDSDGTHTRQDILIHVRENAAPPTPGIKFPDGTSPVRLDLPTIILENVDDPDGDPVEYHLLVDWDTCYCSPQLQDSGALPEQDLVTQWTLPSPLPVADHDTFYVRRWASDGLEESDRLDSLFKYVPTDAEPEDIEKPGCACRTTGSSSSAGGALLFGLALLAFVRRRR